MSKFDRYGQPAEAILPVTTPLGRLYTDASPRQPPPEPVELAAEIITLGEAGGAQIFHQGPGPHRTGTPQKIHSFRYGGGMSTYRRMRGQMEEALWEEYKKRVRAKAGAAGGAGPAPKPGPKTEAEWDAEAEAMRLRVIAEQKKRGPEFESRMRPLLDARDKNDELFTQTADRLTRAYLEKDDEYHAARRAGDEAAAERLLGERKVIEGQLDQEQARHADESARVHTVMAQVRAEYPLDGFVAHPYLASPNPSKPPVIIHGNDFDDGGRRIERGVEAVGRMMSAEALGRTPEITFVDNTTRAHYSQALWDSPTATIPMSRDGSTRTTVHEMGHWVEANSERANAAAHRFLERRTAGETAVPLASLFPGAGYAANEMTRPDKFMDPYVGKDYPSKRDGFRATEVISMGLEAMFVNPAHFAEADPDHFRFTYKVMRGAYSGPGTDDNAAGSPAEAFHLPGRHAQQDHAGGKGGHGGGEASAPEGEAIIPLAGLSPRQQAAAEFKPATTREEAEAYAARFTTSGEVSYRGLDLGMCNEINRALADNYGQAGIPPLRRIKATGTPPKGAHPDALMSMSMYGDLTIVTKRLKSEKVYAAARAEQAEARAYLTQQMAGDLSRQDPKLVARVKQALAFERDVVDSSINGLITHEIGHRVDWDMTLTSPATREMRKNIGAEVIRSSTLSAYSTTNAFEYFAEAYVARRAGEALPPSVADMFAANGIYPRSGDGFAVLMVGGLAVEFFHQGPGPHKTGTPQKIHSFRYKAMRGAYNTTP